MQPKYCVFHFVPGVETSNVPYHQNTQGDRLAEFTLLIEGMHCGSCIRRVTQALAAAGDVQVEEVRLGAARVQSSADSPERAIAALAKAGYAARLEQ